MGRLSWILVVLWVAFGTLAALAAGEHSPETPAVRGTHPLAPPPAIAFFDETTSSRGTVSDRFFNGEKLNIRLRGLPPEKKVTLKAKWMGCVSSATFTVDRRGEVDLARQAPSAGSYDRADATGLLWSMGCAKAGAEQKWSDAVQFTAEIDGKPVAEGTLHRTTRPPGITIQNVKEDGLVGQLYLPPGRGPFPTVIMLGGSEGGMYSAKERAAYLSTRGFACLALSYFRSPGLPQALKNIPLEYFGKAIHWLQKQQAIAKDKLAVWGISRGGEASLLVGAHYPEIKAVVAVVPSPIVWPGVESTDGKSGKSDDDDSPVPAWTWKGKPIPFLASNGEDRFSENRREVKLPDGQVAHDYRNSFLFEMKDRRATQAAMIPIERTNGPILLLGGNDDQLWPSDKFTLMAMKRLKDAHHPFPDEAKNYDKTGHGLAGLVGDPNTFPYAYSADLGGWMGFGGEPGPETEAQRDAARKIEIFLRKAIGIK